MVVVDLVPIRLDTYTCSGAAWLVNFTLSLVDMDGAQLYVMQRKGYLSLSKLCRRYNLINELLVGSWPASAPRSQHSLHFTSAAFDGNNFHLWEGDPRPCNLPLVFLNEM